jgi:uncharacterized protein
MVSESSSKRSALITGAATGLGASFADLLASEGWDLVLVDRQADRLNARAKSLSERRRVSVHPIVKDLTDPAAAADIFARCEALGVRIDLLVNNAGFHLRTLFHETPWADIEANVRVLLTAVVELTHRFLPGMLERCWGRIINISSVSGFMPGGVRLTTYNATKSFLIPFTEGLNLELEGTGVVATVVCPGFMRTDLFVANGLTDVRDSVPGFMWLDPAQVAKEAFRAAMNGAALTVNGLPNRMIVTAAKFVPRKLLRERTKIFHRKAHLAMASRPGGARPTGRRQAAVVTGATSGIGAAFAEALARDGYDVIVVARREKLLQQRSDELVSRFGVRSHPIVCDLATPEGPRMLLARCQELGWPVDVLVNNAGYPVNALFRDMSWRDIDAALQLLVGSVVQLTHGFLPAMIAQGWGRIINVASLAGFEPGSYRSTLYSSSKRFVIGFSESVDSEVEARGVRVTALCPGFTKTEWSSKTSFKGAPAPPLFWMESDAVARIGLAAAKRGGPVAIATTPASWLVSTAFQLAPRHFVGRFLSNQRRKLSA